MNHEGYRDETADRAVAKVRKQTVTGPEPAAVLRNQKTIDAIRAVADAAGMTIMGSQSCRWMVHTAISVLCLMEISLRSRRRNITSFRGHLFGL